MSDDLSFGLYDPQADTDIEQRYLPHWFQPGVAVFITFRTADSMPREAIEGWERELRDWLARQGIHLPPDEAIPHPEELPATVRREYVRKRDRLWHWRLDQCHGECLLKRRELAEIVLDSLRHFDGRRYDLDSAVVMPNHVHLIAQFRPPVTCRRQCSSWLRYTARQINERLGRHGVFWQSEPFDHLIRSGDQFCYLRKYIAANGPSAGLTEGEYLYWSR